MVVHVTTPVPFKEDARDPSCRQLPVTNEPLPVTMVLLRLEAWLSLAHEEDAQGLLLHIAAFGANAHAIRASQNYNKLPMSTLLLV